MKNIKKYFVGLFFLPIALFAQVANDNCVAPQIITIPASGNICVTSTNVGATSDLTTNACDVGAPGNEVWFTYTATGGQNTVTVTPTGSPSAQQVVLTLNATGCSSGTYNTCSSSATNGGTASSTWAYAVGTQVVITVETKGNPGGFQLCITSITPPPSPGSTCGLATILCNKNNFSLPVFPNNVNVITPSCFPTPFQNPVFYKFTVGQSGTCIWNADPQGNAEYDWVMYDITGGCPGTEVCCNFNFASTTGAPVGMATGGAGACGTSGFAGAPGELSPPANVTVGRTYLIIIDNYTTTNPGASVGFNFTWGGTFLIAPVPSFTLSPTSACNSLTTTITNTSVATTGYSWTFGNGNTSAVANPPNQTYSTPGTYLVSLVATSATGCTNVVSHSIVVSPLPIVTVNSPTVCSGLSATVTATPDLSGTYNYTWTVPGGAPAPGNVASFTTTVPGSYSVIITNTVTGCVSLSASGTVTANPSPTVTVNSPTVCSGLPATITATPGTAATYSYAWTVPGGATAPGNVASFTTTIAGTYSVIITNTVTGCVSLSASGTVTLNPLPTVTVNSPSVCSSLLVTVTATPGTAATYSYAWTVPATATAPGDVASFSTTISGTYSVIITNTVTGCVSTSASGTVTLNPLPTVTVNSPTVCTGLPATVTATPGSAATYSYAWTVPGGAPAPGNVASFTTTIAGTYSVIITNTVTGCVSTSASGTVTLNPLPTVTVNSPSVCSSLPVTVTATPGSAGTHSYAWTVPATATAPGDVASFSTTISGTYSVIITNTVTGCVSTSASGTVTLNPLPTVTVNSPTVCSSLPVTVTATPGSAGTYSYAWTVPATATAPGDVASFSTTISGTYSVIITNTVTGCVSTSASGTVTLNPLPTVTVNSPTVCSSLPVTVTATTGSAGTYSYAWTVPATATAPGDVASFSTTISGTYSVIITNTVTGCVSTSASGTVTLNPLPTVTVNSPTVCSGTSATVTATPGTAGTYSYVWTVPFGATNPGDVASFFATIAGTYSVIITNTTTTCVSLSASGIVTVNPLPTVTVNSPSACASAAATVTATTGSAGTYSYAWTVPATATAPGDVASFSTTISGTYSVIITNTVTGCVSTSASGTVTLNPLPSVTVNSPTVCSGLSATVTATPGSAGTYSYVWTVPVGATNPGNVDSFTTTVAGSYSVIITNTITTCVSLSASGTVTLNPIPTVTVNSSSVCFGVSSTVTATPGSAGTYSYAWTVPSTATAPGDVVSFTTTIAGTYSVIITDITTTCVSNSASGIVTVFPAVTISSISSNITICSSQSTNITATAIGGSGAGYVYTWNNGLGVGQNHTVIPGANTTTIYQVTAVDGNGCPSDTGSVTVTVYPNLSVIASVDQSICPGTSTTISATPSFGNGGPYSYTWTPNTNISSTTSQSPIVTPTVTTTYYVTLSDGCSPTVSDSVKVSLWNLPNPQASSDTLSLCIQPSQSITFYNTTDTTNGMLNPAAVIWSFGDGSTATSPWDTIQHTYAQAGTYTVNMTVSSMPVQGGCTVTQVVIPQVDIYPMPIADFTSAPNPTGMFEPEVQFSDLSGNTISNWQWDFAGLDSSNYSNPMYSFPNDTNGVYPVTLTVTDLHGCEDVITKTVIITAEYGIYIPNAFSPDFDFKNDVFGPKGFGISAENYQFMIFDRWGEKMFDTDILFKPWDGFYKGTRVQEGVYVWKLFFKDYNQKKHELIGHVTIIQ